MKPDETISCEVCMDLIPLIQDGVASADSVQLVEEHANSCESCAALLREQPPVQLRETEDQRVLRRIRATLFWTGFCVFAAISLIGVAFTPQSFYDILLFPLVGALGVLLFRRRWYIAPVEITLLVFFWNVIDCFLSGWRDISMVWANIAAGLFAGAVTLLGAAAAALFCYAFRRERK